ncbi:MAG TPA: hypothetical protein VKA46_16960 [Gemmataceae bacterium]|nr:hypothetical protein [Gemmataceae bacterium]
MHYFGLWADPDAALKRYNEQKDALHAGRKPRPDTEGVRVWDVVNALLNHKRALVDSGELSPRMWAEYKEACDMLAKHLGKRRLVSDLGPADFTALRAKMAKRWGPVRLGNVIQRIRTVFKFAHDAGLIPASVRFGPGFVRPTKKTLRLYRAQQGPKLLTADEILRMIAAADVQLEAMILLGINVGFGMADCGKLPLTALDLERGIVDFSRPKTGIARRAILWPETVAAIRKVLVNRPEPKDPADAGLVFLTARGQSWHKDSGGSYAVHKVTGLLHKLSINGRKGLGFYTLRHVFRTVADEAHDQPSADYIMGHEIPHMSAVYRERISDERLKAVAEHVRKWLFPPQTTPGEEGKQGKEEPA